MKVELPLVGPRRDVYETLRSPPIDIEQESAYQEFVNRSSLLRTASAPSRIAWIGSQLVPDLAFVFECVPTLRRYVPPEL